MTVTDDNFFVLAHFTTTPLVPSYHIEKLQNIVTPGLSFLHRQSFQLPHRILSDHIDNVNNIVVCPLFNVSTRFQELPTVLFSSC
jgi:hypothetical protein